MQLKLLLLTRFSIIQCTDFTPLNAEQLYKLIMLHWAVAIYRLQTAGLIRSVMSLAELTC